MTLNELVRRMDELGYDERFKQAIITHRTIQGFLNEINDAQNIRLIGIGGWNHTDNLAPIRLRNSAPMAILKTAAYFAKPRSIVCMTSRQIKEIVANSKTRSYMINSISNYKVDGSDTLYFTIGQERHQFLIYAQAHKAGSILSSAIE